MTKSQNTEVFRNGESAAVEPGLDGRGNPASVPDGQAWGALGMGDIVVASGLTLLSRAPAPEGRRSLFRR